MTDADTAEHDAIVIGAGPAGEVCAGALAEAGLDVAIVERELVGGECSYWACMPSKALLRPAELLAEAARVPGAAEAAAGTLDAHAVLARRDEVIHELHDDVQLPWLSDRGIALYRGQARLQGERTVRLAERTLRARRAVVIATGSGAAIPPVPGLREIAPWTNRHATTSKRVPERLTVLGGGAVGCELAQAWSTLGARTILIEAQPRLLPTEEPFASELLAGSMGELGVQLRLGTSATAAARAADGTITLTLATGEEVVSDELLVAVGRRPHTDDLGLENVGLQAGKPVPVDDRMRATTAAARDPSDWLYAIGDANGRSLLTHAGKYQARIAAATIAGRDATAAWDGPLSPRVVFSEPQIGAVGRTLERARADGLRARAVDADPGATAGASFVGRNAPSGARIVVDEDREVIVGATFAGPEIADMLQAATIALVGEVPLRRLAHAIPPFPTRSEVWLSLLAPWAP